METLTENKTEAQTTSFIAEYKKEEMDDISRCVIYKDPDEEFTPLIVKVSLSLYEMGAFDVAQGTAEVVFEMLFAYETKLFSDTFGDIRDVIPWIIPNALQFDISIHSTQKMYGLDLDSLNIFTKRQKFDEDANLTLYTVEIFTIRAKLKLITFPSEDPFQSIFLIFKLAFDGTPGGGMTRFKAGKG